MDGGAWRATVQGVAKCRTQLTGFTSTFLFYAAFEVKSPTKFRLEFLEL